MKLANDRKIAEYRSFGWWGEETYYDLFVDGAREKGDAPGAVDPPDRPDFMGDAQRRASWAELADDTERTAAVLARHGLGADDIIVMQMPNVIDVLTVYLACAKLGIIVSPVPVQYSGYELRHVLHAVKPKAIVAAGRFRDRKLAEGFKGLAGQGTPVFAIGEGADASGLVDLRAEMASASTKKGPLGLFGSATKREAGADECFTIAWTSGTTGMPKGVPRSHNHWLAILPASYDAMGLRDGEVLLNPFPMTNMAAISGMFGNWLVTRGVLVLHHPFDLKIFLGQIVEEGATVTIAPPAVLTMLLKQDGVLDQFDLSRLRVVGSGSAPLSEFMVAGWKDRGVEIVNLFGSNEGVSLATGPTEAPDPAQRASRFPRFGHPGAHFSNRMHGRVKTKLISIETGKPVSEPGEEGELLIKGPAVFEGYWGSTDDERAEVFDDDDFFRTGDLFAVDPQDEQFLIFKGRAKDIIIRGGVNISAAEIDTLLEGHPKLVEAAVFGMPDEVMGERVWVAVVPKPGEQVSLTDITGYLLEQDVAKYKLPEQMIVVDALPRNPMNKVLRWKLKEMAEAQAA